MSSCGVGQNFVSRGQPKHQQQKLLTTINIPLLGSPEHYFPTIPNHFSQNGGGGGSNSGIPSIYLGSYTKNGSSTPPFTSCLGVRWYSPMIEVGTGPSHQWQCRIACGTWWDLDGASPWCAWHPTSSNIIQQYELMSFTNQLPRGSGLLTKKVWYTICHHFPFWRASCSTLLLD